MMREIFKSGAGWVTGARGALLFTALVGANCTPASSGVSTAPGSKSGGVGGKDNAQSGGGNGGGAAGGNGASKGGSGGGFSIGFVDALTTSGDAGTGGPNNEVKMDALEMCGEQKFAVERDPPEVIIVLDRSGSMAYAMNGSSTMPTRWDLTSTALNSILMVTEKDILWGLKMYPTCTHFDRDPVMGEPSRSLLCDRPMGTHNPCATDGLEMAPARDQFAAIAGSITAQAPSPSAGATPTQWAIEEATATLKARNTPNPKFLLVATDGAPNCAYDNLTKKRNDAYKGRTATIRAIDAAVVAGIPVFVLGIAIAAPTDAGLQEQFDVLNLMAIAGKRERNDPTVKFYPADDEKSLNDALTSIAAQTISCVFPLEKAPPDGAMTRVEVDGKTLKEDEMDGWSFTASQRAIRFNGAACQKLQDGLFKATQVLFGCPGKPLPPPPPPAL